MTQEQNAFPTEWHRRPKDAATPCPICGFPSRKTCFIQHRLTASCEVLRTWQTRKRSRAGWMFGEIVERPKRKPGPLPGTVVRPHVPRAKTVALMNCATALVGSGMTINQAAAVMELPPRRLEWWRAKWRSRWNKMLAAATENSAGAIHAVARTSEALNIRANHLERVKKMLESKGESLFADDETGRSLAAFIESVYIPSRLRLSELYADRLRKFPVEYSLFLGHAATLDDFTEQTACLYLSAVAKVRNAVTANNRRATLLALWRAGFDYDFIERLPRLGLIRRLRENQLSPKAWTIEECNRIFAVALGMPGLVGDIRAGDFWTSLMVAAFYTGGRIGALLNVTRDDYRPGEGLTVLEHKTGKVIWNPIPAEVCDLIDRTNPAGRELLWPWPHCRRHFFRQARKIIESAGVPCPKIGKNLFQKFRRTCLTHCAAVDPAIAQRQGGHSSYAVTLKHYIDPQLAGGLTAANVLPMPRIVSAKPRPVLCLPAPDAVREPDAAA